MTANNPPAIGEERMTAVYELALDGMTVRQIGTELGISKSEAHRALQRAIDEIPPTERSMRRALADDRFNRYLRIITEELNKRDGDPVKLLPIAIQIEAQRARLFGLNEEPPDNKNMVRQVDIKFEMADMVKAYEQAARVEAEEERQRILASAAQTNGAAEPS